ncbi:MAG TPA: SDR family NAD(P)-dependent oxidoreductase [Pirellulales bacterium]|nr:SDR family NAD(P)-dependent oxidoreductase [Pirellulales bacterium]
MEIAGRTFLITGGASGLGAACARRLARRGAHVVIADLNEAAGKQLAVELGASAAFTRVDVTCAADVEQALALAAAGPGGLRGLVQCAGVIAAARIVGRQGPHELELFERVVRVNLVGTFNVLRLAASAMSSNSPETDGERGVIINTASVAAFEGQIGQAAYAASKGGVASLTLPAARELARFGIRVVAIAPGVFETPMMEQVSQEARDSLLKQVPFPSRFGTPDEFAALAEHVIENRMLNGGVVRLDGAARMEGR